jgi:hypothetical protein
MKWMPPDYLKQLNEPGSGDLCICKPAFEDRQASKKYILVNISTYRRINRFNSEKGFFNRDGHCAIPLTPFVSQSRDYQLSMHQKEGKLRVFS